MDNAFKLKKEYTKPAIENISIDREISLMLLSEPGGGVTPPFPSAPKPSPGKDFGITSHEDVFGGSTPFPKE